MQAYKIDIMGIQEHHLNGTEIIEMRRQKTRERCDVYYTGPDNNKHHGAGIILRKYIKADYKKMKYRIFSVTIKLEKEDICSENRKIVICMNICCLYSAHTTID